MIRLTRLLDRAPTADEHARAVRLRLAYDERVKTRLATMSVDGEAVAMLLADARRGAVLRDGVLLAGTRDDGGEVLAIVEAAPQPVARITARAGTAPALTLLRATYHLANRHVPAQLSADAVLIERDPVLESMLRGLGAQVEHIEGPFDPEPGAYDGHAHSHGAAHAHRDEVDAVSATLGEQLSIEAHRARRP
jgi:urease accessory protein